MATLMLTLFLLFIALICGGLGGYGLFMHSQGQKFLLPKNVCTGLTFFALFTIAFVAVKMMG